MEELKMGFFDMFRQKDINEGIKRILEGNGYKAYNFSGGFSIALQCICDVYHVYSRFCFCIAKYF